MKMFFPWNEREFLLVHLYKLHFAQADKQQVYWLRNQTEVTKFVPECIWTGDLLAKDSFFSFLFFTTFFLKKKYLYRQRV